MECLEKVLNEQHLSGVDTDGGYVLARGTKTTEDKDVVENQYYAVKYLKRDDMYFYMDHTPLNVGLDLPYDTFLEYIKDK